MKKLIVISCLLLSKFNISGQSLRLFYHGSDVTNGSITIPISKGVEKEDEIDIHNVSGKKVSFTISRTIKKPAVPSDFYVYFCLTYCFPPSTDIEWAMDPPVDIAANTKLEGKDGLIAHLDVDHSSCTDVDILYRVYNTVIPGDTARLMVHYSCVTGINNASATETVLDAYPNPARDYLFLNYDLGAYGQTCKIVFHDMLGQRVKEVFPDEKRGHLTVDVTAFKQGVYFYSLFTGNKAVRTKKLVIH